MKSTIHMPNFFEPAGECPTCKSTDVSNADGIFAHWECSACGVLWPKEPVRGPVSPFVWTQATRNHHVGRLNVAGDLPAVCAVLRAQKHRPDGTPRDWVIEVLGSRVLLARDVPAFDVRDLESAKAAGEHAARRQIDRLYRALHAEGTHDPQKGPRP